MTHPFSIGSNDNYKFETPTLHNLKDVAHFGHGSSLTTVKEVISHKNDVIPENIIVPSDQLSPEFNPLGLD